MQRDEQIDLPVRQRILRHVRDLEAQTVVAVLFRDLAAALDDVGLEIVADHLHVEAALDGEVIVQDKGQIRLPAAEIHHPQLSRLDVGEGVVDQLDETIDLPVLVKAGLDDAPLRREHAQIDESGDILALGKQIFLLPVVRGRSAAGARNGALGAFAVAPVAAQDILRGFLAGHDQHLTVEPGKFFLDDRKQLLLREVAVEGLVVTKALQLEEAAPLDRDGPQRRLLIRRALGGLGKDRLLQPRQRGGKLHFQISHQISLLRFSRAALSSFLL